MIQINGNIINNIGRDPGELVPSADNPSLPLLPARRHVLVTLVIDLSDGGLIHTSPPVHVPVQHPQTVVLQGPAPADQYAGVDGGVEHQVQGPVGDLKRGYRDSLRSEDGEEKVVML